MTATGWQAFDALLRQHDIEYRRASFIEPTAGARFSPSRIADLRFTLTEVPFERAVRFTREAAVFPVLRDVWREYRADLSLSCHEAELPEPDYAVHSRHPEGVPVLVIAVARRGDRTGGWNQALDGMIAARLVDDTPGRTYYGLTTTGLVWTFGKHEGRLFTEDPRPFGLKDLDELAGALHSVFIACRDQVRPPTPAAP